MAKSVWLRELRRRHVFRVVAAYAVVGWLLIQVVTQVFPIFHFPDWIDQAIVLLILVGFPIALVLAWAFDATPHGIVVTDAQDAEANPRVRRRSRRAGLAVGAIGVLIAIVVGAGWWSWHRPTPFAPAPGLELASARVAVASPASPASAAAPLPSTASIPGQSVAVLPFVNESGEKDQQYFSDGLSEDLITTLSQFGSLKVISRDSSFRFRNSTDSSAVIGAKLGVAHLLEGSVQRAGDEVRVSVELVNTADGSTLWSQRYDRPYKDLFALQDDITEAVADALKAKLLAQTGAVVQSDRPPNGNLAAYNAYLQGQFYAQRATEDDARKAIGYFIDATRLDPRYALAWVRLGGANFELAAAFVGGSEAAAAWDRARVAVQKALALDPNLARAHGFYAVILAAHDHAWLRAEAEAQRAYQLAPDREFAALAGIRAALGHSQPAVELLRQGLPNDPLCAACYNYLAHYLSALGGYDEAAQAARMAMQLAPERYEYPVILVKIEIMHGDSEVALQTAQQIPPGVWRDAGMAFALQLGNNRAAADAALQTVIAKQAGFNPYFIAEIYALRRDPDNLFKWLERTNEVRDPGLRLLLNDPIILRYKNDPRFAAFCRKVGLPTTTDAKALP